MNVPTIICLSLLVTVSAWCLTVLCDDWGER
jgi:hypothetical protein